MENRKLSKIISSETVPTLDSKVSDSILTQTKPVFIVYICLFTFCELLSVIEPNMGLIFHSVTLALITIHSPLVRRVDPELSKLLIALTSVPLIRIVSLISPVIQFSILQWFLVISIVLYSSIFISIRVIGNDLSDYGFRIPERKHFPLEVFIIFCGLFFGFLENAILDPLPIVETVSIISVAAPFIALYFGTGILEELLFRGVIQRHSIEFFGKWGGVIFTTLVFTIFHIGWESGADLVFVGTVGFIFSLVVIKTGSLIGVSFSHAVTNLSLFVLAPEFL